MSRGKKFLLCLLLATAALLITHTLFISDVWNTRASAKRDLSELENKIGTIEQREKSLGLQIEGLRKNSKVQEHVVRDELGYMRAGDVVVIIDEAASTP